MLWRSTPPLGRTALAWSLWQRRQPPGERRARLRPPEASAAAAGGRPAAAPLNSGEGAVSRRPLPRRGAERQLASAAAAGRERVTAVRRRGRCRRRAGCGCRGASGGTEVVPSGGDRCVSRPLPRKGRGGGFTVPCVCRRCGYRCPIARGAPVRERRPVAAALRRGSAAGAVRSGAELGWAAAGRGAEERLRFNDFRKSGFCELRSFRQRIGSAAEEKKPTKFSGCGGIFKQVPKSA